MAEDAHVPITDATMFTTGTKHAVATGGMDDAWRVWKRLPNNHKTWIRWKTMWSGAFLEKREIVRLTGIAYNGMANQANEMDMENTILVALDNLANPAVQNNDTVKRLVISNESLSASLAERNTEITRLLNVITILSTGGGSGGGGGSGTSNGKTNIPPWEPTGYCWTHGYNISVGHSSATCTKFKDGHDDHLKAKQGDIQGVCIWNRTWKPRAN